MSSVASRIPRRVLILGSRRYDSVADSYRRALERHFTVKLVDSYELATVTPPRWTGLSSRTFQAAVSVASNLVLRDPQALIYPRLLRVAKEFAPDIVLVTTMEALPPRVVRELKAACAMKIFGVFSDALSNFGRGYFFDAPYDALFFKDHYIVDKLRTKLGWTHVYYLPQACDPELHRPLELTDEDRKKYTCDVAIAGNLHYFRLTQLASLTHLDLRIYGGPPMRWMAEHPVNRFHAGFEVYGDLKCRTMRAARIVLNNNHYAEIAGTNKRTFEVAAMGAFQLTDTPAIADVFVPNEEVAVFDTLRDMTDQVHHYLAHPEQRLAMAERACVRAHREHTYAHRWVAHLDALGLGSPASFPVQSADVTLRAT